MTASCKLCDRPDDWDVGMVACDVCGEWFHFRCAEVTEDVKDVPWSCGDCSFRSAASASSICSRMSQESSVFTLGLRMLEDELKEKQKALEQEKALEEKYLRKQKALQEEYWRSRQAFLLTQGAVGGSDRASVFESEGQQNVNSKVEGWMETMSKPEDTGRKPTGYSDPRGAYPKAPLPRTSSVAERFSKNDLEQVPGNRQRIRVNPMAANHPGGYRMNNIPPENLVDLAGAVSSLSLQDDDDFNGRIPQRQREQRFAPASPVVPIAKMGSSNVRFGPMPGEYRERRQQAEQPDNVRWMNEATSQLRKRVATR